MDILGDWAVVLMRWAHVLAGITWIGTSFYFNWFDLSVREPDGPVRNENVRGTLVEVHGGNFYYHEQVWPNEDSPRMLHHGGPAQLTFLTGILLMGLVYWLGARTYLVDDRVLALSPSVAIAISAGSLVAGWLIYHRICLSLRSEWAVFWMMVALVAVAGWGYLQVFSPRAAIVHVGAMLGTIMTMNVVFVIIPSHIGMRRQLQSGESLNRELSESGKRRSQHNNYFTLPVLFSMIAVHFPAGYSHPLAWLTLPLVMLSGVALRHFRNEELARGVRRWSLLTAAGLVLVAAVTLSMIGLPESTTRTSSPRIGASEGMAIVRVHCATCHSATPTDQSFSAPPAGLILDTLADVRGKATLIYQRTVVDHSMPLGNLTGMTDSERARFGAWLEAGAPVAAD